MVTCLLEEPGPPPFVLPPPSMAPPPAAAGGGGEPLRAAALGRCARAAVAGWLEGGDFSEGVPLPPQLLADGCPREVWEFLEGSAPL